ncbi:hypothetical protein LTS18_005648 [Coniosporium uncinatum]|uniref:Uncharacterized protein n=1 Tax=Coniosporium uncinatum TaxID=93489 RepID=A0ACC3DR89_9PEZI|nr:hypothetical protein LTS18_005648 [Coniosporium uncinatum]
MSVNWVMLSDTEGFVPLPNEQRLYKSPPRTTISLQTLNKFPGREPYSVQSSAGSVHLTNRRSFTAPILNLQDTHVTAPFFGPNVWTAIVKPVPGGGIPPQHAALELKMTFKDGGAYDFATTYERIKERLQQALETARESGHGMSDSIGQRGAPQGVNMDNVHLDELPAYQERGESISMPTPAGLRGAPLSPAENRGQPEGNADVGLEAPQTQTSPQLSGGARSRAEGTFNPPAEPPPGYEEVQRESIADELERRMRSPH